MGLSKYNWKFDENVAPIFDDHVTKSVPFYSEIHNLIKDIAAWFMREDTNVYDIGSSTGTLLKSLKNTYDKNINYIGIDKSNEMNEVSKKISEEIEIITTDITKNFDFSNSSFITSVLTLQFIDENKRQGLINNVYHGLNNGGAFILVEKVLGNNAKFNEIWSDLYHDLKHKNGLSKKHIYDKSRSIRGVMNPVTYDYNLKMLEKAGFKDIDVFFKWNNFVGIIAIKE